MKTVTIAPPHGKIHSLCNMYPIAVGRKSASHDFLECRFTTEIMLELSSGSNNVFYWKTVNACVGVHIELLASLQDQPKRRQANYIMLGGSKYSA